MGRKSAQEKEEARLQREERKKAREERMSAKKRAAAAEGTHHVSSSSQTESESKSKANQKTGATKTSTTATSCVLLEKFSGNDVLSEVMAYLPARELGAFALCCRTLHRHLREHGRVVHLMSRLSSSSSSSFWNGCGSAGGGGTSTGWQLCTNESDARRVLERSLIQYPGGTGNGSGSCTGDDAYPRYAQFLEACGCGAGAGGSSGSASAHGLLSVSPEHTLCVVSGGEAVYGWGVGRRGQLGLGERMDAETPTPLDLSELSVPRSSPSPSSSIGRSIRIVQVSAGGGLVRVAHSLLLDATGKVYSFGTGQYGALGHGYSPGKQLPDQLKPRLIRSLLPYRVTCVAAGELHSAAVTSDGDLYTWGDGFCGQLGSGSKRPRLEPAQVTANGLDLENVCAVSCGNRHTLCLTELSSSQSPDNDDDNDEEGGQVFSFGLGHFGALGRAYTPFQYGAEDGALPPVPTHHHAGEGTGAGASASAGGAAAVLQHMDLLANVTLEDSSDQCIPVVLDVLKGVRITKVSAGHRHSLVLDDRGILYSFGNGSAGALGHGHYEKLDYPVRIQEFLEQNERVTRMSAGVDFSMAVTARGHVYSWGTARGGRLGLEAACGLTDGDRVPIPRQCYLGCTTTTTTTDTETGKEKPKPKHPTNSNPEQEHEYQQWVDVECGYVHAVLVGVDGTLRVCGRVGVHGAEDGQGALSSSSSSSSSKEPRPVPGLNLWHRQSSIATSASARSNAKPRPKWKKYGKYELKGRTKMMEEAKRWNT